MEKTEMDRATFAERMTELLLKLYQNEKVTAKGIAEEYAISERTAFRYLEKLANIVEHDGKGVYQLSPFYQANLTKKDLQQFAEFVGIEGLFPKLDNGFLSALLQTLAHGSFTVKGNSYEDNKSQLPIFQQLDHAIKTHHLCRMDYKNKSRTVQPYKMVNYKGIWYLAAVEDDTLKAYNLSKISLLYVQADSSFIPDSDIEQRIEDEDNIWFSEHKHEVVLKVDAAVAYYFERRKLFPGQEIIRQLDDGGLLISCQMSHPNQILPLIRYWIPNIQVVSPGFLEQRLKREILDYFNNEQTVV